MAKSRLFMLIALAGLVGVFLAPLWQITLEAAQFPGGLTLHIWINKLSGSSKHIVQNINILNHYIGMQKIEPDSIPELRYFPYVVYGMMALGLLAAWLNRAWGYLVWAVLLMALGALGIYDFYLWLYDYGTNLDPTAPIKVPGMTYMPPLIGEKELLNFKAHSYPHWGSAFLALATGMAVLAFWVRRRTNKQ